MPSLTNYGQQLGLYDDNRTFLAGPLAGSTSGAGGIANLAAGLHLFVDGTAVFDKDASVLNLVPPVDAGYTNGTVPIALTKGASWVNPSAASGDTQIVLNNQTFTATGNPINDVGGAFIQDSDTNIIAWWERSTPITLAASDSITADQLTIRIV